MIERVTAAKVVQFCDLTLSYQNSNELKIVRVVWNSLGLGLTYSNSLSQTGKPCLFYTS